MPDASIHTLGKVFERVGPVLYRVELPNGKSILAHLSKPLAERNTEFETGDNLLLELTPYDFDTARILGRTEELRKPSSPAPESGEWVDPGKAGTAAERRRSAGR